MSYEKGDSVVFHDKHSEHDGDVGEVTQVSETMFGDNTYIVQFEEGQEAGIPEDALEPADEADEDADEDADADADTDEDADADAAHGDDED